MTEPRDLLRTIAARLTERVGEVGTRRRVLDRLGRSLGLAPTEVESCLDPSPIADPPTQAAGHPGTGTQLLHLLIDAASIDGLLGEAERGWIGTLGQDLGFTPEEVSTCLNQVLRKSVVHADGPRDGVEESVTRDWCVGDVILGVYEVRALLGEGGMGKVYRVHHRGWGQDLAVKTPNAEVVGTPGGVEGFEREAQVWGDLGMHPNIVACYYVRRLGGIPRVFAEYVDGGSLAAWLRREGKPGRLYDGGPELALERILDISIQMAWGLDHAHGKGVIHQDVKPHNVMVTEEGTAKVTDFGLANARKTAPAGARPEPGKTAVATYGGMTPGYCSREQALIAAMKERGEPAESWPKLTRRTDLWSWGVTVLEMFLGEPPCPLGGHTAALALEDVRRLGASSPPIPPLPSAFGDLLATCFAAAPEDRPKDLRGVAEKLREIYRRETGRDYGRPEPTAVAQLADGLNNRAASLLDLGRPEEAERLLEQALRADPHHLHATHNLGLLLWRSGRMTDDALVRRLHEAQRSQPSNWEGAYLLGRVHVERGDPESAGRALEEAAQRAGGEEFAQQAIAQARQGAPGYRRIATVAREGPHLRAAACAADRWVALLDGRDGSVLVCDPLGARCRRVLSGHLGSVRCADVTPDGRFAITGGEDRMVRFWDLDTGDCLRILVGHEGAVGTAAISPNGRLAVTAAVDRAVIAWDLATGQRISALEGPGGRVWAMAVTPDERFAILAGRERMLRVCEIATGRCVRRLQGHTDGVKAVAVTRDGRLAVSASTDNHLRVWDLDTGHSRWTLEGHTGSVTGVQIAADGRRAISASSDRTMRVWDLVAGRCAQVLEGCAAELNRVWVTADGSRALSGDAWGILRIWDVEGGACERSLSASQWITREGGLDAESHRAVVRAWEDATGGSMRSLARTGATEPRVALSRRLPLALSASPAGMVQAWETGGDTLALPGVPEPEGSRLWTLDAGRAVRGWEAHPDGLAQLVFSSEHMMAVTVGAYGNVRVWDVGDTRCVRRLAGHGGGVTRAVLTSEARRVITAAQDGALRLWDTATGRLLGTLAGHEGPVNDVALAPEGERALSAGRDRTVRVWQLESGRCTRVLQGHADEVTGVAWSVDGERAVSTGKDGTVRIWEMSTGRCLRTLEDVVRGSVSAAIAADGKLVVWEAGSAVLQAWEVPAARSPAPSTVVRPARSEEMLIRRKGLEDRIALVRAAMSKEDWAEAGRAIQEVREDPEHARLPEVLALWRKAYAHSRRGAFRGAWCLRVLEGHRAGVRAVSISGDGARAATASLDRSVRVWDVASGACLRVLEGHEREVWDVALTPDGNRAVSVGLDNTLRFWDIELGACLRSLTRSAVPFWRDFLEALSGVQQTRSSVGARGARASMLSVALAPDARLAITGTVENNCLIWDLKRGRCVRTLEGGTDVEGVYEGVRALAVTPDFRWTACGGNDRALSVWDLAGNRCLRRLEGHQGGLLGAAMTPDGRIVLTAGGDRTIRVWDPNTGACLRTLEGHGGEVCALALSSDGRVAVSGAKDQAVRVWDVESGACLRVLEGHAGGVWGVALTPDARLAVSAGADGTLRSWFLDWELDPHEPADWDEGARSLLEVFLARHTPFQSLTPGHRKCLKRRSHRASWWRNLPGWVLRRGGARWDDADFEHLRRELEWAGFGWLQADGVRRKLSEMAASVRGS